MEIIESFSVAIRLLLSGDRTLWEVISLSLAVSLTASTLSCVVAFPLGAVLAIGRFRGRRFLILIVMSLMGLPPVVVGLLVYLLLSSSGPLGALELLFTPSAMVIAQCLLITPIVTALSYQAISELNNEYNDYLRALHATSWQRITTLLWDARVALSVAALAGVGRAFAEVGAVMIVGGNINHHTRVMTTAIALETSRGALATALALGMILLIIGIALNASVLGLRQRLTRLAYA